MVLILKLLCYGLVLLFGIAVSICFSAIQENKKNVLLAACLFLLLLFLQILSWQLFGLNRTKKLYPLIVHLPLVIFLTVVLKSSWLVSISSVFSAYLCCQIPKWIGAMAAVLFPAQISYYLCYMPAMVLCYVCLRKYVSTPANRIMTQSRTSCLLFCAVPFFYYTFDYTTTIYTNWLYSGSVVAVQFIPSMVSMFYFVFILIYYEETQREKAVQQERNMMAAQLKEAKMEFDTLRQMQDQTRRYRHDMRHHFALLQVLAAKGDMEKIIDYLQNATADLDAFTPTRYCKNETINLILSFFHSMAKQSGVQLSIKADVPDALSISDTELCSLISNSLENAIAAASSISVPEKRTVSVLISIYKEKLLILVENPYAGDIVFVKGFPQTSQDGHGYGTRNISAIAELHGGQALFSATDSVFSLRVMLPLKQAKRE